jgi:hypothetical protein
VSHYRDEWNPEAVHFPARLHVMATHGALALLLALAVLLIFLYNRPERTIVDLVLACACAAALVWLWPRRITTDQHGIRRAGLLKIGARFIAWKDVRAVNEAAEIPLLPQRLFGCLDNHVITIRGVKGVPPVRFTSRHSGRETFLHELKRWGALTP